MSNLTSLQKKESYEKTNNLKINFMIEQANQIIMRKMKSPYTHTLQEK